MFCGIDIVFRCERGAVRPLKPVSQVEGVDRHILVALPTLRISGHQLSLGIISDQSLKAVDNEGSRKGIVSIGRIERVRLVAENKNQLLLSGGLRRFRRALRLGIAPKVYCLRFVTGLFLTAAREQHGQGEQRRQGCTVFLFHTNLLLFCFASVCIFYLNEVLQHPSDAPHRSSSVIQVACTEMSAAHIL